MGLQTKTFSAGDFAYQSWSNAYVWKLTITEESVDVSANTSLISYLLQLCSGSNNRFQCDVTSKLALAGTTVKTKTENIYLDYNTTKTLLSGTATVKHNTDGSLNMTVSATIDTTDSNSYAPPDYTLSGTMALTQIARTSVPTVSPAEVSVGESLTIKTNRQGDFKHTLKYEFGDLEETIKTGVLDSYTWKVPEKLAGQIPADTSGEGRIICETYSGTTLIGSDDVKMTVLVPENDTTRPKVSFTLTPVQPDSVPDKLKALYIQGISRVQATITATAWHSSISSRAMKVQGSSYTGSTPKSDILLRSGNHTVTCSATDKREYTGSASEVIKVYAYQKPTVAAVADENSVICCRCDEAGNPDINGRKILLKVRRSWYSLEGLNMCTLTYRIRQDGGSWSEYKTLLATDASTDEYADVLAEELEARYAYQVELTAQDDLGEYDTLIKPVGTANTPLHLGDGGRNLGLGRYCDYSHTDAVDVGWDLYMDADRDLYFSGGEYGVLRGGFFSRGMLANGTDFDKMIVPGVYRLKEDGEYLNRSGAVTSGYLVVMNPFGTWSGECVLQIEINYSGSVRRMRSIWYGTKYDWVSF